MPIKPEHLDELLSGYEKPEDLLGEDGLFKQLKKALLERAPGAELESVSLAVCERSMAGCHQRSVVGKRSAKKMVNCA
jgi:hypothetical protein